jgi:hypothetical protein
MAWPSTRSAMSGRGAAEKKAGHGRQDHGRQDRVATYSRPPARYGGRWRAWRPAGIPGPSLRRLRRIPEPPQRDWTRTPAAMLGGTAPNGRIRPWDDGSVRYG